MGVHISKITVEELPGWLLSQISPHVAKEVRLLGVAPPAATSPTTKPSDRRKTSTQAEATGSPKMPKAPRTALRMKMSGKSSGVGIHLRTRRRAS